MLKNISYVLDLLHNYYKTYPSIEERGKELEYNKNNNSKFPNFFYTLIISSVCVQVLRFIDILTEKNALLSYYNEFLFWTMEDIPFIIIYILISKWTKETEPKKYRNLLDYHLSLRKRFQVLSIIPKIVNSLLPLFILEPGKNSNIAYLGWVTTYTMQIMISSMIIPGLKLKIVMIVYFNFTFVFLSYFFGYMMTNIFSLLFLPLIFSTVLTISQDRREKENFLLKQSLKQQNALYEQFLGNIHSPILILSKDKVLFKNDSAQRKLGEIEEEIRLKLSDFLTPEGVLLSEEITDYFTRPTEQQNEMEAAKNKIYSEYEGNNDLIEETSKWQIVSVKSPIKYRCPTMSIIFRNIDEDLRVEHQKIEDKYKNMLFFSLSHELRTPLNFLQNFLSIAKRLVSSSEDRESRIKAKGAWSYLRFKINDTLDYSQILAGDFALHLRDFSLKKSFEFLKKTTIRILAEKRGHIQVKTFIEAPLLDAFFGDRDRIEQVLFNFLTNAIKYTQQGSIELFAKMSINGKTEFGVSDTGRGIHKKQLESLTQMLSIHREIEMQKVATGFGLVVSRMICKNIGTQIRVKSVRGKGSIFSFLVNSKIESEHSYSEIPYDIGEGMIPPEGKKGMIFPIPQLGKANDPSKVSVLVVDDNQMNRVVVSRMISKYKFKVTEAEHGVHALEKLDEIRKSHPSNEILIFMDVDMPIMDGCEATKQITVLFGVNSV